MYESESAVCNEKAWLVSLLLCNSVTAALGIIIFGLSLGTIQSDIFVLEVWQFLAPVFQIACADIACGVFMCVSSGLGLCFLNYRARIIGKVYYIILILMFTYELCIGVATIIISDEKTVYVRAVAISMCVDPTLKSFAKSDPPVQGESSNFAPEVSHTRLNPKMFRESALDKYYGSQDPALSVEECSYFVDVSTPCGSLLICASAISLYMLYCTWCIRDYDKREGMRKDNVLKKTWNDAFQKVSKQSQFPGRTVQFQEQFLGAPQAAAEISVHELA